MGDSCDGKDKTWAFQPIFTLSACEMGLTCQAGEEATMTVLGKEVENKAERVKIVISDKTIKTKTEAQGPAHGFFSCKPLRTLVISKSGTNLHPLQVRKEVRGISKAMQNRFCFYVQRRPLKEEGTARHLYFHLTKVLALPGPAVPKLLGGTVLGWRGSQAFLWAS